MFANNIHEILLLVLMYCYWGEPHTDLSSGGGVCNRSGLASSCVQFASTMH